MLQFSFNFVSQFLFDWKSVKFDRRIKRCKRLFNMNSVCSHIINLSTLTIEYQSRHDIKMMWMHIRAQACFSVSLGWKRLTWFNFQFNDTTQPTNLISKRLQIRRTGLGRFFSSVDKISFINFVWALSFSKSQKALLFRINLICASFVCNPK